MFPNVNLAKATGVMFPNVNITMRLKWISQNKNVQPKQNVPPQTGRHANQSISQNSLASPRRQTRGVCLCLARLCEAVSEEGR